MYHYEYEILRKILQSCSIIILISVLLTITMKSANTTPLSSHVTERTLTTINN